MCVWYSVSVCVVCVCVCVVFVYESVSVSALPILHPILIVYVEFVLIFAICIFLGTSRLCVCRGSVLGSGCLRVFGGHTNKTANTMKTSKSVPLVWNPQGFVFKGRAHHHHSR